MSYVTWDQALWFIAFAGPMIIGQAVYLWQYCHKTRDESATKEALKACFDRIDRVDNRVSAAQSTYLDKADFVQRIQHLEGIIEEMRQQQSQILQKMIEMAERRNQ